jgi:hypothetical protein
MVCYVRCAIEGNTAFSGQCCLERWRTNTSSLPLSPLPDKDAELPALKHVCRWRRVASLPGVGARGGIIAVPSCNYCTSMEKKTQASGRPCFGVCKTAGNRRTNQGSLTVAVKQLHGDILGPGSPNLVPNLEPVFGGPASSLLINHMGSGRSKVQKWHPNFGIVLGVRRPRPLQLMQLFALNCL